MLGVQKGVAMVGQTFKPKVLISDAAPSIINAFYAVFENAERNIVCWAHVKRNLQQKTKNMELLTISMRYNCRRIEMPSNKVCSYFSINGAIQRRHFVPISKKFGSTRIILGLRVTVCSCRRQITPLRLSTML